MTDLEYENILGRSQGAGFWFKLRLFLHGYSETEFEQKRQDLRPTTWVYPWEA